MPSARGCQLAAGAGSVGNRSSVRTPYRAASSTRVVTDTARVGAFVAAQEHPRPTAPGPLVNLFEGHAVLPADGAEPSAERDGVLA